MKYLVIIVQPGSPRRLFLGHGIVILLQVALHFFGEVPAKK
jgi:hypothetical protein